MKQKTGRKRNTLQRQILQMSVSAAAVVAICVSAFLIGLRYTNQQQLDRSVEQTAEILSAEIKNYQTDLESIAKLVAYNGLMLRLSQANDLASVTSNANNVSDLLNIVLSSNENVSNVIVTDFGNLILGVDSGEYDILYAAKKYLEANPTIVSAHVSYERSEAQTKEYFYLLRSLSSASGGQYYVIAVYNMDIIERFVSRLDSSGSYSVVDHEGVLVAGNDLQEKHDSYHEQPVVLYELGESDWCIRGYAMNYANSAQFKTTTRTALVVLAVFVLFIFALAGIIIRNISVPVVAITEFMQAYSERGYSKMRLSLKIRNELMDVGDGINRMLDALEKASEELVEATKIIYRTKVEKQRSELIALQIQINPHFLFNTLNCIHGIAAAHQEREISEIVVSMASIMRYSLGSEKYTTLRDEIDSVHNYCRIIRVRFHDRVKIGFCVDEAIQGVVIPKMLLQPIVENAVSHGLERDAKPGEIEVRAARRGDVIEICVSNTGLPIGPEEVERVNFQLKSYVASESSDVISAKHNIGMRNVHARLQILYGKDAGVQFSAREGGGAVITLRIPETKPEKAENGT